MTTRDDDGHKRTPDASSRGGWSEAGASGSDLTTWSNRFADARGRRYERGAVLGRGGMGTVFAVQDTTLDRSVALKVAAQGSTEFKVRLQREAKVLAMLEHPSIVSVLDAGVDDNDAPYYVMPKLAGRTLAAIVDDARDDPSTRFALLRHFATVCDAVAHAHERGIVHRDLKPSNIMLGDHGRTWVVDWGLARSVRGAGLPMGDHTTHPEQSARDGPFRELTLAGHAAGTPQFMSPEQRRGDAPCARMDVWSLGAVLHVILFATAPGDGQPRQGPKTLPIEVDAILGRALHRDPELRYPEAGAFAADIHGFIDGGWVQACQYSKWHYLSTLVRMYRRQLALVVAVALVLAIGLGVAWQRTVDERERALTAEQRALEAVKVSEVARSAERDALSKAERSLQQALIGRSREAFRLGAHAEAELLALEALSRGPSPVARGILAAHPSSRRPRMNRRVDLPICSRYVLGPRGAVGLCIRDGSVQRLDLDSEPIGRGHRWVHPVEDQRLIDAQISATGIAAVDAEGRVFVSAGELLVEVAHASPPVTLVPMPRSARLAFVSRGDLHWRGPGGEMFRSEACRQRGVPFRAAASLLGEVLAGGCTEGRVLVGDWPQPDEFRFSRELEFLDGATTAVLPLRDGHSVWVGGSEGTIVEFDLHGDSGPRRFHASVGRIHSIVSSPDGQRVAVNGERAGIEILDRATGMPLWMIPRLRSRGMRFADAGQFVVATDVLETYVLPSDPERTVFVGEAGFASAALSPDGTLVAAVDGSGFLTVWDTADGRRVHRERWQELVAKDLVFSPDGETLTVVAMSSGAQQLSTRTWQRWSAECGGHAFRRVAWLGSSVILLRSAGRPATIDAKQNCSHPSDLEARWSDMGAAPDGQSLVLLDEVHEQVAVMRAGSDEIRPLLREAGIIAVDITNDETVALARRGSVRMVTGEGVELSRMEAVAERIIDVAIDGDLLAAGTLEGRVLLWDWRTQVLLAVLEGHDERVVSVDFAAGGERLVSAGWDAQVRLWDLSELRIAAQPRLGQARSDWGLGLEQALSRDFR